MIDIDLHQLAADVAHIKDRMAIQDCIHRHARGHDRFDIELMASCYHPDGLDEHGAAAIHAGPDYGAWANTTHARGALQNLHNITTHTCEIDGDTAHAESYVLVGLLNPDGVTMRLINGRYVDRLEKRNGQWKIALRRCTLDMMLQGDASLMQSPYIGQAEYIRGMRDRSDVSYLRPLTLDAEVERL